nr:PREDICTED: uncharacterized protein LOC105678643 [Linepithema humile]
MLLANGASIPTIAGAVEEEEYARSEANSGHYDGYVTDHTDLASEIDIDESEYRRELLNDKWRILFDKFDPEGFGEIPLEDFLVALRSSEWKAEIPANKRDILLTRAKESHVEAVTFQDFVNVEVVNWCVNTEDLQINRFLKFSTDQTDPDVFENVDVSGLISKINPSLRASNLLQIRRLELLISERLGYKTYLGMDFDNTV